MRITKVYTRTGDKGDTGLVDGSRVSKNHPRIESYGTVDELSSILGWVRAELREERSAFSKPEEAEKLDQVLEYTCNKLFTVGADLATPIDARFPGMEIVTDEDVQYLEEVCDYFNAELPPLKDFILPGGSKTSCALHQARTVARRAERCAVRLGEDTDTGEIVCRYLNRLSDALFILARRVNQLQNVSEPTWVRQMPAPKLK